MNGWIPVVLNGRPVVKQNIYPLKKLATVGKLRPDYKPGVPLQGSLYKCTSPIIMAEPRDLIFPGRQANAIVFVKIKITE